MIRTQTTFLKDKTEVPKTLAKSLPAVKNSGVLGLREPINKGTYVSGWRQKEKSKWKHIPRVLRERKPPLESQEEGKISRASFYLFVVYEHGSLKTLGCPLEKVCRLLRSHVNQHTLSYQEGWQS